MDKQTLEKNPSCDNMSHLFDLSVGDPGAVEAYLDMIQCCLILCQYFQGGPMVNLRIIIQTSK